MEKTVSALDARRRLGALLDDVDARRDRFIVTRYGEPVVAIVPLTVYEQMQRQHDESNAQTDEPATGAEADNALTEDEAMEIAIEAVAWARAELKCEQTT